MELHMRKKLDKSAYRPGMLMTGGDFPAHTPAPAADAEYLAELEKSRSLLAGERRKIDAVLDAVKEYKTKIARRKFENDSYL
jgi:hypothetical protein